MKLYKLKYTDINSKTKYCYVQEKSYGGAETLFDKKVKNVTILLNIELLASEGIYGKPSILLGV